VTLTKVKNGIWVSRFKGCWTFVDVPEVKADSALSQSKARAVKT